MSSPIGQVPPPLGGGRGGGNPKAEGRGAGIARVEGTARAISMPGEARRGPAEPVLRPRGPRALEKDCTSDTASGVTQPLWVRLLFADPFESAVEVAKETRGRLAGDCMSPVQRSVVSLPSAGVHPELAQGEQAIEVRCRHCRACRLHRARMWYARATREAQACKGRIWFCTLTFRRGREVVGYRPVQLWLKRLRKAGAAFRFLAVQEQGDKNGRTHWHVLLFEVAGPIRKAVIKAAWREGFSHVKLAAPEVVAYVASYVADAMRRVVSSSRFGSPIGNLTK